MRQRKHTSAVKFGGVIMSFSTPKKKNKTRVQVSEALLTCHTLEHINQHNGKLYIYTHIIIKI